MSARKTAFVPGEYYHLYNRGNSKQKIFHDDEDRIRFEELLFLANGDRPFNSYNSKKYAGISNHERGDSIVAIGAYCMMPNHFHLLVTQTEGGSISKFMQKLTTAYVMYYNEKYDHSGGLFEGKFKAIHLPDDRYLKYVFSYIHLNPLKLIDSK